MEKYKLDKDKIQLHNILYSITSAPDYDMERIFILENLEDLKRDEYVIVEGYHCSCYDFNDTEWHAMKYSKEELIKLARENENLTFYSEIEKEFYNFILNILFKE